MADGAGNWSFPGAVTGPNITATATDASGNTSEFSTPFVLNPAEVVMGILEDIIIENPGTPLADKVGDALASVETAWEELNKEPPDNQAAVGNVEGVAGSLCDAVTDEGLDPDEGNDLMDTLAGAARQLADTAIEEAIDAGGNAIEIAFAEGFLAEGDDLRDQGFDDCVKFKDAINKYKDALVTAEGALP